MPRSGRILASILLLLFTLFLLLPLLLYRLRLGHLLAGWDRPLLHAPLFYFVLGAMVVCPLAALVLGWRMVRSGENRMGGRVVLGSSGLLILAFVGAIGLPLVKWSLEPARPKNPSTPRAIRPVEGIAVFPGAEGFGTRTSAGRGGKIIAVTSLADSGAGTLRSALSHTSPRIVVFRVSGTIELKSVLFIDQPFVTVAGQTAPGDGICLKNCGIVITAHDVLVQHLRIRPGNEGNIEPDDNDAVAILGKHGGAGGAHNIVLDHVSASWSEDEAVSTWYAPHDITICWSIVSEALNRSRHRKVTHSAGLLIGDSSEHVSVHHCLLAHNSFRNPLVIGGGTHDFVNNVVYDWGDLPGEIADNDSNSFLNFVGNYYRPGPSSGRAPFDVTLGSTTGTPRIYVEGNLGTKRRTLDEDEWAIVTQGWVGQSAPETYRTRTRFSTPPVTTWSAAKAVERVLEDAGATLPRRDSVDRRVVADVENRTGHVIDSPRQAGGYPRLITGTPLPDADEDGMPDVWERQKGLDPDDPSDASQDQDADGYTNIEEHLHSLG